MRNDPKETFRLRMLEASLLPPGDAMRGELEAELATGQGWARDEWLSLLEENERIRLELIKVEPPAALSASLLRIPSPTGKRRLGKIIASPLLRVAATVVLLLGLGSGVFYVRNQSAISNKIARVAELALARYVNDQDISVITLDPDYMARHLDGSVPFPVKMPPVQSGLSLIGGRSGSLGIYPAVYSRWVYQTRQQSRCAIIQFRSRDFGLPENVAKEVIHSSKLNCPSAKDKDKDCDVIVWSEGGNGYAMVADSTCALSFLGRR